MNNKIISVAVLLCVLVCTVVVFLLIFDEYTKLFYINMATTCVCEAILLCNIPLLSSQRLLTFKNAAMSYVLDIYAIVLFLWTVTCSLFVDGDGGLDTLYIGMLVTTIVAAVAFGVVAIGGNVMEGEEARQDVVAEYKDTCLTSFEDVRMEAKGILGSDRSTWGGDALRRLNLALDKMENIPSERLKRNPVAVAEVTNRLNVIVDLLKRQAESGDDAESLRAQAARKIEQLKDYIMTIK